MIDNSTCTNSYFYLIIQMHKEHFHNFLVNQALYQPQIRPIFAFLFLPLFENQPGSALYEYFYEESLLDYLFLFSVMGKSQSIFYFVIENSAPISCPLHP